MDKDIDNNIKDINNYEPQNKPRVSVIVCTYNRASFIPQAIDSIIGQSYTNLEIIIIDDASDDNTEEIINRYINNHSNIYYYRNENNLGIANSRNKAISLAKGEYIAPLDSDDFWMDRDKLKKQVEFLDANPDYALLGGGIMHVDANSRPVKKVLFPVYDSLIRNIILQFNPFAQSTLLFRKDVVLECGGYSTEYKVCDDYDLWMKIGLKYKFTNIPQVLAGYRVHGGNITHTKRLTTAKEILEIVKKYAPHYKRRYIGIMKAYLRIILSYFKS